MSSLGIAQLVLILAIGWGIYRLGYWIDHRPDRTES